MTSSWYLNTLRLGPMQNFIYLIGDSSSREVAVIDPGWEVPKILEAAKSEGYRVTKALITHHHFDHTMGIQELLDAVDMPVYIHRDDVEVLKAEQSSLNTNSLHITKEGDDIQIGSILIKVIHTPGHTPGSQCFLVNGHLFSGDTLMIRACGRWDLPGGDPAVLYKSLNLTLKNLPESTILCPGHDYTPAPTSTIGEEKRSNPFLKPANVEEFLRLVGRV